MEERSLIDAIYAPLLVGRPTQHLQREYSNMSSESRIKITKDDLIAIYGEDYHFFEEKIIPNCRCVKCDTPYTSTIVNYDIFLNDLNDTILKGFCAKCGSPVNRYLETGGIEGYLPRIAQVKFRRMVKPSRRV